MTLARIVTSLRAFVVPFGRPMIGTFILRATTTFTFVGGAAFGACVPVWARSHPLCAAATTARAAATSEASFVLRLLCVLIGGRGV